MEKPGTHLKEEPRYKSDYTSRQTEAARRVLVDLGQVLGPFEDSLVLVGGSVPDLLIDGADEPHVGSIDIDLALDAEKLSQGQYAKLVESLLKTGRYHQADELFKLFAEVDLEDGEGVVRVDVDFLKSPEARIKKNKPRLTKGFRPLDVVGCEAVLKNPIVLEVRGRMINGAENSVEIRVASIPDFLIMKAYALLKRDKPKDAYDICYCLDYSPGGIGVLVSDWKARSDDKHVVKSREILTEKFESVNSFGPQQVVEFYNSGDADRKAGQARRAYELVQRFLGLLKT